HLVSLEAIQELHEFSETAEVLRIGAALSLSGLAARWTSAPPAFREWLDLFASPTIRNRATLGGNFATASPIGDAAPFFGALDAVVYIAGLSGVRSIPLIQFFTGYRQTALEPGELLISIEIPKPLPAFVRFYKIAKRRMDDISTVAAGMALDEDSRGRITGARFVFGGVAPVPWRAAAAEEALIGQSWNEQSMKRAQGALARTLAPITDHRGSAEYRLFVAQSLIEKFRCDQMEIMA